MRSRTSLAVLTAALLGAAGGLAASGAIAREAEALAALLLLLAPVAALLAAALLAERPLSVRAHRSDARRFLDETLEAALRDIRLPEPGETRGETGRLRVQRLESGRTFATYALSRDRAGFSCRLHVFLNVNRMALYFYAPAPPAAEGSNRSAAEEIMSRFSFEADLARRLDMELAVKVGYEESNDRENVVFGFWTRFEPGALGDQTRALGLGQDAAQLTRSMLLTAVREKLALA